MLWVDAMTTQISTMLAVSDSNAAIAFYKAAFGFLAHESPPHGTRSPASVNFTTVRIELFVDDPVAVHRHAVAAGAVEHSPVEEHTHTTRGPSPITRILQGAIVGPFGHMWLVGKDPRVAGRY